MKKNSKTFRASVTAIIIAVLFPISINAQEKVEISLGVNYLKSYGGVTYLKIDDIWRKTIGSPSMQAPFSLRLSALYRINNTTRLGLGIRVENNTLPIYVATEVRPFTDRNIFLYGDLGYSIEFKDFYGGLLAETGIGYFFKLNENKENGFGVKIGSNFKNMQQIKKDTKLSICSISLGLYYTF